MKDKPVIPRELANGDVDDVIEHYPGQDAEQADLGFIEALERAYPHIGRHPATGSPRYAHELNLPGLRSWPLARYPHLVFYVELQAATTLTALARAPWPSVTFRLGCWVPQPQTWAMLLSAATTDISSCFSRITLSGRTSRSCNHVSFDASRATRLTLCPLRGYRWNVVLGAKVLTFTVNTMIRNGACRSTR